MKKTSAAYVILCKAKDLFLYSSGVALRMTALLVVFYHSPSVFASEVIQNTPAEVVVRENPKSGKPYVVITKPENATKDPFEKIRKQTSRPDYRMLDPNVKNGQIPYDGPVSDRKKVYIFAASVAAAGTASGLAVIAAAPAATGVGATGGAGMLAGSGVGVAAGTFAIAEWARRPDPNQDDFSHTAESKTAA